MNKAWLGFHDGPWQQTIDIRGFILGNCSPYDGDETFLAEPTAKTNNLRAQCDALFAREHDAGGVLDIDTETVAGITAHPAGFIDPENEVIVGLQTDKPLRRAINPFGGIRTAAAAAAAYGHALPDPLADTFTHVRRTHNDGVFAAYTEQMRRVRKSGVITGLPDAYGRGRIIGDYRRVALYGLDRLIAQKRQDMAQLLDRDMDDDTIPCVRRCTTRCSPSRRCGRLATCTAATLACGEKRAGSHPVDVSGVSGRRPETNGAANSIGRVSTFFDIYLQRDLRLGLLDEAGAQELVDQFVLKLRLIRHLRTRSTTSCLRAIPVDHRSAWRHDRRRPTSGHTHHLPVPAHAAAFGRIPRAQPHRFVVEPAPGTVQALLRTGQHGHQRPAIRERRPDASGLRG
jgi:formate C-acetyltransferase